MPIILVAALISGCGQPSLDHAGKTVFRYNDASGILSLDPAFSKDQSHIWVCQQLYNGLVELDSSLRVRPSIARSWTISDSGLTYTFTLRDDVYFYGKQLDRVVEKDGVFTRRVKASDVVFSLNRLTDPLLASPGGWVLGAVKKGPNGRLDGVTAINDSTVQIRLSRPSPAFLSLLAMPYCSVVPEEVVKAYGADFRSHPCGTGPFMLAFWKEGVELVMHRNPNYFEVEAGSRLPYLDAIAVSFITDKQSAFLEFLQGRLDFISGLDASYKDELLTPDGRLQQRHQGKFELQCGPYLNTEYLGILVDSDAAVNASSPLLDADIRRALSLGFDRAGMMLYLRNNMGTPGIYGFVPPGLPSFLPDSSIGYSYDPQKARLLLRRAGHPEGKGLPEIVLSTTSSYLDLCEFIKSQWEELGFRIHIDVNQAAVNRKLVAEQKLSFFRGSWIADYPDAENYLSLFYSPNFAPAGPNYTRFHNPVFDSLYVASALATDDSVRYAIYRSMDGLVMEQAPVIVLYYDKVVRLVAPSVTGLTPNAMNLLWLKRVRKSKDIGS
ncbi:MAG: ABC transporter substrate-binding protein [Bacteroidota bacterium]